MAEEMRMIYKAIAGVMEDIGAVGKEKEFRSNQGSYKFRGIDDVMNALHPSMVKNKIFVVPVILEQIREVRTSKTGISMYVSICKIRYEFYAEDGSCISAVVIGEGMDTGDKATNKAMSIAFKYACFQVFCIPTEEMIDPDSERPELSDDNQKEIKKKSSAQKSKTSQAKSGKSGASCNTEKVNHEMITEIEEKIRTYGAELEKILALYKVSKISDMTIENYKDCVNKFKIYEKRG